MSLNNKKAPVANFSLGKKRATTVAKYTTALDGSEISGSNRYLISVNKNVVTFSFKSLPLLGVTATIENVKMSQRVDFENNNAKTISKKKALELPVAYHADIEKFWAEHPAAKSVPDPTYDVTDANGTRRYNRLVDVTINGVPGKRWKMFTENGFQYLTPVHNFQIITEKIVADYNKKEAARALKAGQEPKILFVKNTDMPSDSQWYKVVRAQRSNYLKDKLFATLVKGKEVANGKVADEVNVFLALTKDKITGTYTVKVSPHGAGSVDVKSAWATIVEAPVAPFLNCALEGKLQGLHAEKPTSAFVETEEAEVFLGETAVLNGQTYESNFVVFKLNSAKNIVTKSPGASSKLSAGSAAKIVKKSTSKPEPRKRAVRKKVDL